MSLLDVKRRRDMRRQRAQFLAVALTIGLGVMLFASTYDAYQNLNSSYKYTYGRLDFADITVVGAGSDFAAQARQIEGVAAVETRLQADIPMRVDGEVFVGRIVGYPSSGQPEVNKIDVRQGSYFAGEPGAEVVIEDHMAKDFDLGVGDRFEMHIGGDWAESTISGVAISAEYIWPAKSRQEIFPTPGTFGVVFGDESLFDSIPPAVTVSQVLIVYNDGADVEATDAAVRQAAEQAGAGDVVTQAKHPSNETLQLDVSGFQELAVMFPALFMTAAAMAAFILLTRIVYSQRSQIGTLRASGMDKRTVLRHYLSYGVRLGLISGIVGVLVGMALAYVITGLYTQGLGIPDTVRGFHPITPFIGVLFGLAAGAIGAYAPARTAFRVSPAEAMRGDVPAGGGGRSLFEVVVPPLRSLPVRWLMVLRGIGRNKRRSLSTALGVVLAAILIMVSWGMIDTIAEILDRQFNVVSVEDADIILAAPVSDQSIQSVAAIDGVDRVEPVITLQATVGSDGRSYSTTIEGYQPDTTMHGFPDGLPQSGILAGKGLKDELGVEVGDEVTIGLPTLGTEFSTKIEGFLDEPIGTYLYIDQSILTAQAPDASVLGAPGVTILKASFDSGVDRKMVISDIADVNVVAAAVDARTLYDLIQQYLGFFYAFVGVMLVLGGALAFALMFNTISVNVAERSGEFATMRANGLSHANIARLVATENVLLTVLGLIPGVLIGYWSGAFFLSAFSNDVFILDFYMSPLSIAGTALALLLVAGLSLIPALRTVRRLDIGKVVRERAA
ncbi:MAG: FtsX-like permease family protein [Acidimicrobiia bacterium]